MGAYFVVYLSESYPKLPLGPTSGPRIFIYRVPQSPPSLDPVPAHVGLRWAPNADFYGSLPQFYGSHTRSQSLGPSPGPGILTPALLKKVLPSPGPNL